MAYASRRVAPVLGLAAHLGRGMQRVATDAVIGPVRSLPRTIGDLDAPSLSKIMERRVASVSVIGGDAGTSSRARLALTGDDVPASVFVKMPAETVATRLMGELGRLAQTEVLFYRELSPQLTGVPASYGSAFDSLTGRFVIVLEDLAVDPCVFPDTLHPLDKDQASMIVELLAQLPRDILGTPARLGVLRIGRSHLAADRTAVEHVGSPNCRANFHPRRGRPFHHRPLPRSRGNR